MLRRRIAICFAVALPSVLTVLSYGCGASEPPLESLCDFLGNPTNCERQFYESVGDRCGAYGYGQGPTGTFLTRDMLDLCILEQGGQVVFDPALDLTQFPITSGPIKMKFLNGLGDECGNAAFTSTYSFTVTIDPYPPPSSAPPMGTGGGSADAGDASCPSFDPPVPQSDAGDAGMDPANASSFICGGSFGVDQPEGRDIMDISCPSGETHHTNRLEIGYCPEYGNILPHAEIESKAGGIDVPGKIAFRIFFPPTTKERGLVSAQPDVVEYFECSIPAAPKACANGVKDTGETDQDCGGVCGATCGEGQKCITGKDCLSGVCKPDPMGMTICQPSASSSSTGGGGMGGSGGMGGAGGSGGGVQDAGAG